MSRIFISHSSKNNDSAVILRDWLSAQGWDDVFLDLDPRRGIAAGERWERSLNQAAQRCEAVLFLVSRSWLGSDWCQKEFNLAHRLNKRLFGLLIEDIAVIDLPSTLTGTWQLVELGSGRDHVMLQARLPGSQDEVHVTFSQEGLNRLRIGLERAGLDARFFAWPPENDPKRSPYRGLLPLEAADAGIFFGREAPTIEALDRIRGMRDGAAPRLLVLLGASGAGKSSFLRAGLLPRLGRDDRNYLTLPVIRPERAAITGEAGLLRSLEATLAACGVGMPRAEIRGSIEGGAVTLRPLLQNLIARIRTAFVADTHAKAPVLVLAIDQGEELFLTEGAAESAALLNLLRELLADDAPAVQVVITIRSDSYEQMQTAKALEGIIQQPLSLIPMPRSAYQAVIEGPVARLTETDRPLVIEPALTQALLSDIEEGGGRDALPLLAFTLERLYLEYGGRGRLTLKDYDALGRIKGSIEAAVDRAFRAADNDPRISRDHDARLALLRRGLIPWLAGIDPDTGSPRRQKARISKIPEEARPLINLLVEQRLLSTDVSDQTGETIIEPAHESLLRQWSSLQDWLREDFAALTTLETVKRAARDWTANEKGDDWLAHRAGRLEEAEHIMLRLDLAGKLDATDCAYLAACRSREEAALAASESRLRLQRRFSFAAAIAAAIMTAVGLFAYWQKTKADAATSYANIERIRADQSAIDARAQRDIAERERKEATRQASRSEARAELLQSQLLVKDFPNQALLRGYEAASKMSSLGAGNDAIPLLDSILNAHREVPFKSPYYPLSGGTGFVRQSDPVDAPAPATSGPQLTIFVSRDVTKIIDDTGRAISKPLGSGDVSGSFANAAAWLDDNHFVLATGAWTREDGELADQRPWNSALRSYSTDGTLKREYLGEHPALLISVAVLSNKEQSAVLAGDDSGNLIVALNSDEPIIRPTGLAAPLKNIVVLSNHREQISLALIFGRPIPAREKPDQDHRANIENLRRLLSLALKIPVNISYLGGQPTDDSSCAVAVRYELFVCGDDAITVWEELEGRKRRFTAHSSPVTAIALSPRSPIVVTGSQAGDIRIWMRDGRLLNEIPARGGGQVNALGFIDNGHLLLSSHATGFHAWDLSDIAKRWQTLRDPSHIGERFQQSNWVRFFDPAAGGYASPNADQLKSLMDEHSYSLPAYAGWERFLVAMHSSGLRIFDGKTSVVRDIKLSSFDADPTNKDYTGGGLVARGGGETICAILGPAKNKLYAINAEIGEVLGGWTLSASVTTDIAMAARFKNGKTTCLAAGVGSLHEYSPVDKSVVDIKLNGDDFGQITSMMVPDDSDMIVLTTGAEPLDKSSFIIVGRVITAPATLHSSVEIISSIKLNGLIDRSAVSANGARIAVSVSNSSGSAISEVRVFDQNLNIVATLPGSPDRFIDLQFNREGSRLRGFQGNLSYPRVAYEEDLNLEARLIAAEQRIAAWKQFDSRAMLYKSATGEKNGDRAKVILADALALHPSDATFKLLLANREFYSAIDADAKARAMLLYDDSILLDNFNPIAHYMRGRARAALGDHEHAVEDFTSAIELPHILPQVGINTGMTKLSYLLNLRSKAELYLRRANSLVATGNWQTAIGDVAWLRAANLATPLAYELEGQAWEKSGDASRAIDSYDQALKLFEPGMGFGLEDYDAEVNLSSWRQYKRADYKRHVANNYRSLGRMDESSAAYAAAKALAESAYATSDLTPATKRLLDRLTEDLAK